MTGYKRGRQLFNFQISKYLNFWVSEFRPGVTQNYEFWLVHYPNAEIQKFIFPVSLNMLTGMKNFWISGFLSFDYVSQIFIRRTVLILTLESFFWRYVYNAKVELWFCNYIILRKTKLYIYIHMNVYIHIHNSYSCDLNIRIFWNEFNMSFTLF